FANGKEFCFPTFAPDLDSDRGGRGSDLLEMAKEASNGEQSAVTKPRPTPSPLRFSKFFQANLRILVTGGAGFIGSHLVDRLMENEKNEVIVVDNFFTGSKDNLRKWIGHPRFELIRHDVTETLLVEVDQIYHLACPASPIFYKYNPVKTIKTNVIGTLNMLGLAKRVGARILLTSTSEVYGDPLEHPQKEEYWGNVNPIGVRSCYDEGKRVAETLMFDYHRQHGIEIRIARIFNTYGPRMNIDDGRVVSNFIAQALRGEHLTVQAPGTQTRSFCYVSDMVDGLIRLMEGEHTGPINLGNPGEFTMMELAETVKELIDPSVPVKIVDNTPDDPRQRKPDITKAKELLGWEPKITLRQGLPLMEEDFRQRLVFPGDVSDLDSDRGVGRAVAGGCAAAWVRVIGGELLGFRLPGRHHQLAHHVRVLLFCVCSKRVQLAAFALLRFWVLLIRSRPVGAGGSGVSSPAYMFVRHLCCLWFCPSRIQRSCFGLLLLEILGCMVIWFYLLVSKLSKAMAKEASNGEQRAVTKPPPTPSPLRFSKFFQANLRILVTGGAGFIGSHLVDRLMENEKNEVIVVDNFFTGSKDNLRKWIGHPRFELIRHDVTEPLLVEVDQIYHLACPASPIFYKYNPVKTIKTNVIGTLNMLGLAKRVGARILLTSTSEVYGDPLEHPQKEEYWGNVNPIGVRSCYDEGKRVAETLMFDYHRQHGIEIRIARIFNTYGPRMNIDDGRVVSNFIAQALRGEHLTVQAPGTQTRSFCYVSDMVDGLIRLMEGKHTGPINVGNPGEFTMMELAETVKELINPSVPVKIVDNTPDDPRQRKPDITKAKELLRWEPKISLRQGLPLMEEDFRQRLGVPEM
ncbi:hypothetical protein Taro_007114, partial [Colocasia esculenta]|nr:hypothetical protein [Colocasia esculenta]